MGQFYQPGLTGLLCLNFVRDFGPLNDVQVADMLREIGLQIEEKARKDPRRFVDINAPLYTQKRTRTAKNSLKNLTDRGILRYNDATKKYEYANNRHAFLKYLQDVLPGLYERTKRKIEEHIINMFRKISTFNSLDFYVIFMLYTATDLHEKGRKAVMQLVKDGDAYWPDDEGQIDVLRFCLEVRGFSSKEIDDAEIAIIENNKWVHLFLAKSLYIDGFNFAYAHLHQAAKKIIGEPLILFFDTKEDLKKRSPSYEHGPLDQNTPFWLRDTFKCSRRYSIASKKGVGNFPGFRLKVPYQIREELTKRQLPEKWELDFDLQSRAMTANT